MADDNRIVQQAYRKFRLMAPWLARCTNAVKVEAVLTDQGNYFFVRALWGEATEDGFKTVEHVRGYTAKALREHRTCIKDLGREFIREVLEKRGI